jgi:sortase A
VTRTGVSAWLRRAEIAFFVVGCTSLGWALSATLERVAFQAEQERDFSEMERAAPASAVSGDGSAPAAEAIPSPARDPLLLGRIEIPRLGLAAIVREGADDATLAVAVGHIPGTARPGQRGNVALAGHRDTFFRELRRIRRHDTIRISTSRGRDVYLVDSTEVVGPRETRVLETTDDARLTLVTCFPFDFVGSAPNRFIVRASLMPR